MDQRPIIKPGGELDGLAPLAETACGLGRFELDRIDPEVSERRRLILQR
jgi:hypothetical protein